MPRVAINSAILVKVGPAAHGDLRFACDPVSTVNLERLIELSAVFFMYVSGAVNMMLDRFVARR